MHRSFRLLLPLLCLGVALAGCDSFSSEPFSQGAPLSVEPAPSEISLSGYTIEALAPETVSGGTRFTYRVTGDVSPVLNWFFLETCGLTPLASFPSGAEPYDIEGVSGLRWGSALGVPRTREYSYTFPTSTVGATRVAIRRGSSVSMAFIQGPCGKAEAPLATLSGSVFVDVDEDGQRNAESELGIKNVLVEIFQGNDLVKSVISDPAGAFSVVLPQGSYSVTVPTSGANVFNAQLYSSYYHLVDDGEPAVRSVNLNGDVSGVDFGFIPDVEQILFDLTRGAFQTQARSVAYWRKTLHFAIQNNWKDARNNPGTRICDPVVDVCSDDLEDLLDAIFFQTGDEPGDYLFLAHPYRLLAGEDPYEAAYKILSAKTSTDWEITFQNTFAVEANFLNGWGSGVEAYDEVLISLLEGWLNQNDPNAAVEALSMGAMSLGGGGGGTVELTQAYLGGGGGGTVE